MTALLAAARATTWRRNEACRSIAEGGNVGCVLSGAVRKYSIRFNGQRQIVDLLMPGDFIGLVALDPEFSVEAVCDATLVAIFRLGALVILSREFPPSRT
ncbi:MAG TPA: cyclic nucleotide-binding domain-containing protein [Allosphingosinicella sp.]|nr:cyclic nucleotide-binding domain-containing protein [Allosphingosinicella sp.]